MKNLLPVIYFLLPCNQVLSRRLENAIDNRYAESHFAKPYEISNGAAPLYHSRNTEYDEYDENHFHHRVIFPDVDWSDEIPNFTAQRKIRQCLATCQPDSLYQPVCGTDGVTYRNLEHMQCFMRCGLDVQIRQMSPCPGWSGTAARPVDTTTDSTSTSTFNLQACISSCPTTHEYNPVCGTDRISYDNNGKLRCAQLCGKDVQLFRRSPCPKKNSLVESVTSTTTPRSATTSLIKVRGCMASCVTDPEYSPVCGTNNETFYNLSRLNCAINCGVDISLLKSVPCHIQVSSNIQGNKENDDDDYDIDVRVNESANNYYRH